ncbi:DUF6291 domain-containing protein [Alistipes putredinis]|uniref:DUF6291 domain-containing protein n=1 Tax=Alistipes putredinis TaxID=28117 RepID=UPI003AEFF9D7
MANTQQKEKPNFLYYTDWAEQLLSFPADLRLKIDDAVKRYVLYDEEPTDRDVLYSMFGLMRAQIDRDRAKYADVCNKNSENANKRWKNERMRSHTNGCNRMRSNAVDADNDNDNDKDNDKDIDKKLSNESKESADKPHKAASKRTAFVAPPTENCSEDFLKFQQWVADNAPRVSQMKEPMTEEQLRRLKGKYSTEQICDILLRMHNYSDLQKKNISAYLTALNWLGRNPEFNTPKPTQQNEKKRIYKDL